ncbi:MAG TPA: ribonuclease R [Anaeromyxobacteraceae bacterium]|nr:ribonuclease R [Anaeromyxobacteraceae bacterium]
MKGSRRGEHGVGPGRRRGRPGGGGALPAPGHFRGERGRPQAEEHREDERPIGTRVVGTLTRHRDGYGFVAPIDRKGEDVFVPAIEAERALSGDLVRVEIAPGLRGRTAGRHLEVVERRRRWVLGTYFPRGRSSFVVPADRELVEMLHVKESKDAEEGDLVKVALAPGPRLEGEVVERVGRPGEPKVEVLKVAYAKGFSDLFPDDVLAAAAEVPDHVTPDDRRGRRDLTDLPLVTIDGADARDFDDAVYVERRGARGKGKGKGYRLVVAIADVSHYVRAGAPLDDEALRRGTSVYFPDQVLPMLPERLSNGICSLNPNVDRLCMVADLQLDARGRAVSTEIYEGVMRSHARCTYEEVARVLAGERVPERERFRDQFALMGELQEKLGAIRKARGAIDLDLPEAKIVLGEGGRPVAIERRPRNRAHRVIEEFMLAANEAVARWFGEKELPTIYRVHGLPDEDKLEAFRALAETHGFAVPEGAIGPKQLNALLEGFRGHAQERALSQLLLRAMMQALYSPENIGHFGLAAEHYLHFTSPIRRYPDLIVHRLIRETLDGRAAAADDGAQRRSRRRSRRDGEAPRPRNLEEVAALASERERAAMQCEREIAAFYAALFMKEHVGERFAGVVASVLEFGIFVELKDHFVEGLVKTEDLGVGLQLDTRLHALVDRARGRAYRIGDEVEVEVLNSSPSRRQIDLALVEGGRALRAPRGREEREAKGGREGRDRAADARRPEFEQRKAARESKRDQRKDKKRRR